MTRGEARNILRNKSCVDCVERCAYPLENPEGYCEYADAISTAIEAMKEGEWIVRTRHEHFPSGKEYTELICPFCGRTDHNGDGCYCGYCGCKMEVEDGDK